MKYIKLFAFLLLSTFICKAQDFPLTQRSLLVEEGGDYCEPCFTWARPAMQYIKTRYDSAVTCYSQAGAVVVTTPIGSRTAFMMPGMSYMYPYNLTLYTPIMNVNHYLKLQNIGDSAWKAEVSAFIDSANAEAPIASPIFDVIGIGDDSMIVITKTKFLQNASGVYRVAVLLLQDSIRYFQVGAPGDTTYYMHQLTGPERDTLPPYKWSRNDSLYYRLGGDEITAGSIFTDTFHFHLEPFMVMKNMRPYVVVWKYDDAVLYDYATLNYVTTKKNHYINGNEYGKSYTYIPTATPVTEINNFDAALYPNPSSNTLYVTLSGPAKIADLRIFDLTGRPVFSRAVSNRDAIDVTALPAGQYFYAFYDAGIRTKSGEIRLIK
jgi:hypothetical protein